LKIKSLDDVKLETEGLFTEITEMLDKNKDEETLNALKRNIMRVLILMSKDKGFIQLMKNINSLEHFIFLLKSDLKLCEESQKSNSVVGNEISIIINLLPDFIKLVLSILKNYDLSQFDIQPSTAVSPFKSEESINIINQGSSNASQIMSEDEKFMLDIYFCLLKSLYLFNDNLDIVSEVFEFIGNKDLTRKFFTDYEKTLDFSQCKRTF
jgi:hypothetical protein